MAEACWNPVIAAIRAGDEALDRGLRGPAIELALLREAGLLAAPLAVANGGLGWGNNPQGARGCLELLMALGGASLPIARLYEGHVNAIKLIEAHGSPAQQNAVAERVREGSLLGVWGADSERPVQIVGAKGIERLTGVKTFASGVGDIGLAIVTARSPDGLFMVLADAREAWRADPGAWDVDAMIGSRSGRFDCTGLPASRQQRLGAADALFLEPDFHGGLWRLAACYAGALTRMARVMGAMANASGLQAVSPMRERLGQIAIEAKGAVLWATAACLAVETGDATPEAAVSTALFAREAIESGAARAISLVERAAGTTMHRRGSELGRLTRDLRFYLRQADLDGKLALATGLWLSE